MGLGGATIGFDSIEHNMGCSKEVVKSTINNSRLGTNKDGYAMKLSLIVGQIPSWKFINLVLKVCATEVQVTRGVTKRNY